MKLTLCGDTRLCWCSSPAKVCFNFSLVKNTNEGRGRKQFILSLCCPFAGVLHQQKFVFKFLVGEEHQRGAAVLFVIAKFALGFYFGSSDPGSTYGAAGSIILIMLWVSYSGLILLFGAEFTYVLHTSQQKEEAKTLA